MKKAFAFAVASALTIAFLACYGVPEDETGPGDGAASDAGGARDGGGDGGAGEDSGSGQECATDFNCPTSDLPWCDTKTGTCVECYLDGQCPVGMCDLDTHTCTGTGDDTGPHDTGVKDAGTKDAGVKDGGVKDGGTKDVGPADTGPLPCQDASCPQNAHCSSVTNACECDPGFVDQGGACVAVDPGDPQTRTKDQMCQLWADGRQTTATFVWQAGPAECDPGTLEQAALDDALNRLNMYRRLTGLNSVTYDVSLNAMNQKCAIMEYKMGYLSHQPDPGVPCYTAEGAQGAGSSNLALGAGNPADAMDMYIWDSGVGSLGHRRWVLNPPYGPAGIGFAGNAQCLYAFGGSGGGSAEWVAWPNPGFTPAEGVGATWSWSASMGVGSPTVKVTRVGDGTDMPVTVENLPYGYGPDTIAIHRTNWDAVTGQIYRVEITGSSLGKTVTYDVNPVTCP